MSEQATIDQVEQPAIRESRQLRIRVSAILLDAIALIILALLPALFFWRLFTPYAPDLASIPFGDFTDLHYPNRLFLAQSLAAGESPFWNPYVVAGHSTLGDIQFQIFYPLTVLLNWLSGANLSFQALEAFAAMHLSLAGIFTYLFARRLVPGRLGPFVAALVFAFGGYLTSFPVQQTIILQTSVWLPLILLLLDIAISSRRYYFFILAAFPAALAVLAGHPQTVGYVAIIAMAFGLYRLWETGFSYRKLLGLIAVPVFTVGLAAVQLYPSLQHLQLTARTDVSFAYASTGFSLKELLGVVLPSQFGGGPLYIGLLPLFLALFAILTNRGPRARVFWAILAFLALLLSFGGNVFAQPALYATIPFLKFFRNHERAAFIFCFSLAMLAAYGLSDLRQLNKNRLGDLAKSTIRPLAWITAGAFALALILSLAFSIAPDSARPILGSVSDRAFFSVLLLVPIIGIVAFSVRSGSSKYLLPLLVVGLVAFDLFSTNWHNNIQAAAPEDVYPNSQIVQHLQADDSGPFRISSEGLLPGGGNAGALLGLQDVVGNSPLELDTFHQFDDQINEWQRWRLLNVKYVITKRQFDDGRLIHRVQEDDIHLYEIDAAARLPRAYLVPSATIASSQEEALRLTDAIDPLTTVVLRQTPGIVLDTESAGTASEVNITDYSNGMIAANVFAPANSMLVFSEVNYPGWQAEVDGKQVQILEANYLLRAIPLPAGEHHVRLVYNPASLGTGSAISIAALIIAILAILAIWLAAKPSFSNIPRR